MKLRIISLNETGAEALVNFLGETSRKKSVKEKLILAGAKALGSVKAKIYSTDPYSITVSFSAWKKIPKHLINISQVKPMLEKHWFPDLVYDSDYKVKVI